MERRRLTGTGGLECSPIEALCGLVRGFAGTPFVTRLGLGGMAALANAMLQAGGDLAELEAVLTRFFGRDLPGALAALDALIRALECEGWDPLLRARVDVDADWGCARDTFAGSLRRVRDRLSPRAALAAPLRLLPR